MTITNAPVSRILGTISRDMKKLSPNKPEDKSTNDLLFQSYLRELRTYDYILMGDAYNVHLDDQSVG
jgi:hypothetical protein